VTTSPSEMDAAHLAERYAGLVGADRWSADFGTAKIHVSADSWVEAHRTLKEHLPFFSWLSAIDWRNEQAVGEPLQEEVAERFEILSMLGDASKGEWIILSTEVSHGDATLPTISEVYGGANWHEREAWEMFGIDFAGHPQLEHLYLPDGFEGNPLRKTFALLTREVKPWPGTVDVEDMPSTENPEAGDDGAEPEEGAE
jgi:NADH:ubiquinone oxidoreductase subunit C